MRHRFGFFAKRWLIAGLLLMAGVAAAEPGYQEGVQYRLVDNPQRITSGTKVEVAEFFSYGCHICYDIEPSLESWVKARADRIDFLRVTHGPDFFRRSWGVYGQSYYALETLGAAEKLNGPLFKAIHQDKERLDSQARMADFVARQGIDKKAFTAAYDSFAVRTKLKQAQAQWERFGILLLGTPAFVINGKYIVSPGFQQHVQEKDAKLSETLKVMDYLIAKESKPTAN
ncbi:MAG TPA: thiol:disulfide interchange protein DsbA/DsbL [Candidatus Acidoferrales bacterium]|nr:thiol:disulfide interchange protein DsbA/DsbL [Candidatus Acidoferrales bacterium]